MTTQATAAYNALLDYIRSHYPGLEVQTGGPGKYGKSMLRYRKSGRSFCTFFEQEDDFHLLIVLGAKERAAFEQSAARYAADIVAQYNEATTFHDGKWICFVVKDDTHLEDFHRLLALKRKPA